MENINIEKMTIQDVLKIEKEFEEKFDDFWNINILKSELLNDNSLYFVAKKHNEILGFVGILINVDFTEITNIVVKKDFRKSGIGKMLLEKSMGRNKE